MRSRQPLGEEHSKQKRSSEEGRTAEQRVTGNKWVGRGSHQGPACAARISWGTGGRVDHERSRH